MIDPLRREYSLEDSGSLYSVMRLYPFVPLVRAHELSAFSRSSRWNPESLVDQPDYWFITKPLYPTLVSNAVMKITLRHNFSPTSLPNRSNVREHWELERGGNEVRARFFGLDRRFIKEDDERMKELRCLMAPVHQTIEFVLVLLYYGSKTNIHSLILNTSWRTLNARRT